MIAASKFYLDPLLNYDVYVFHRPNVSRGSFVQVNTGLRKLGATLIADYDDLIFGSEELALVSSAVKNNTLSEENAVKAFQSNLEALLHFDKVTASTEPLTDRVKQFNPGASVEWSPNVIPRSILSIHRENRTPFLKRPPIRIGYFAGTRSHDKDFPIVDTVLHRVLCENPDLNLLIVGPVAVPRSLSALPNVTVGSVVNFLRLPALISTCSSVIAPLEPSEFNNCKSRVKFLEAALGGCQLIASPIPDMEAIGSERLVLAKTADDWYEALSSTLDDEERADLAERNFSFLEDNSQNDALKNLAEML